MKEEKLVYIVVNHIKKPLKSNGKKLDNKYQIYEKTFLSDNVTKTMLSSASLVIDIKNRIIVKSKSEYENIGKEAVINHYISSYVLQIVKFYKDNYNIDIEVLANEI